MNEKIEQESKLRNQFNLSEEIQRDFGGDFKSFLAFSEADLAGRIKICTPGRCGMMTVADFNDSEELVRLTEELGKKSAMLKKMKEKIAEDEKRQAAAGEPCEP